MKELLKLALRIAITSILLYLIFFAVFMSDRKGIAEAFYCGNSPIQISHQSNTQCRDIKDKRYFGLYGLRHSKRYQSTTSTKQSLRNDSRRFPDRLRWDKSSNNKR